MDKGKSSTLKRKTSKMFSRETSSILGVLVVVLSYLQLAFFNPSNSLLRRKTIKMAAGKI